MAYNKPKERGGQRKRGQTPKLEHIAVNPKWAYQPDEQTNLNDLVKNPIPFVGVGKDTELAELFYGDGTTRQSEYISNTSVNIADLQTLQPFVLESGVLNYKSWDSTERPYVVEFEGKYYLLDGNHRVAKAKLDGKKTITVDISRQYIPTKK